jgi:hypothetical protein
LLLDTYASRDDEARVTLEVLGAAGVLIPNVGRTPFFRPIRMKNAVLVTT